MPVACMKRVADRRADESEAAPLELLAHRLRPVGLGGQVIHRRPVVLHDGTPSVNLHRNATGSSSSSHARALPIVEVDLAAVADDAGVGHAALDVVVVERRHVLDVETSAKAARYPVDLAQDRRPRQARLRAFEDQELEQRRARHARARPTPGRGSRRTRPDRRPATRATTNTVVRFGAHSLRDLYAQASTSTRKPAGRPATATVERAGRWSPSASA